MNKTFILIAGVRICIESIALYYTGKFNKTDFGIGAFRLELLLKCGTTRIFKFDTQEELDVILIKLDNLTEPIKL